MKQITYFLSGIFLLFAVGSAISVRAFSVHYSYDASGRLVEVDYGNTTIQYSYDATSNIKKKQIDSLFRLGDVSGDGQSNIVDALFIARHAVGLSVPSFNEDAADVNCNGQIDIVDALLVARKAVGLTVNGWCGNE